MPPTPPHPRRRAWVEVDTGAIGRNLARVRRHVGPGVKIIAMVKCGGYGLGVANVVAALAPGRPFGYGVATVHEGIELRDLGVREPVMICCPVPPSDLPRAIAAHLIPTISDLPALTALTRLAAAAPPTAPPLPFQIEIDTGMGRAGFPLAGPTTAASHTSPPDAAATPPGFPLPRTATGPAPTPTPAPTPDTTPDTAPTPDTTPTPPGFPLAAPRPWWPHVRRAASRNLHLFGIFTHLHSADEPDLASARRQIRRFDDFVRAADGIEPGTLLHCANSAGALRLPSGPANAVRPGIYLYGGSAGPGAEPPETAVAIRARVVLVRDVPAGATAGYGAAYRSDGPERWAAAGIGYGDGLPRTLGNRGWGLAGGRRVPVLGRISMDTTVVGVSESTSPGDVVTFLGRDGKIELTLEEVAELADTIGHEVLTGLSRRLPRIRMES